MVGYRRGIGADLAHERGHMRRFSAGFRVVGLGDIGSQPHEAAMIFAR